MLPVSVFPVHPTSASAIPLSLLFPSPPTHLGRSRSQSHTSSLVLLDPTPHPMPIIDGRQHVRDAGCLGGGRLCSHRPRSCCLRRDARFQLCVLAGGRRGLQYHTARAPGVCYRRRWRVSGPSRPRVAMIQLFLSCVAFSEPSLTVSSILLRIAYPTNAQCFVLLAFRSVDSRMALCSAHPTHAMLICHTVAQNPLWACMHLCCCCCPFPGTTTTSSAPVATAMV